MKNFLNIGVRRLISAANAAQDRAGQLISAANDAIGSVQKDGILPVPFGDSIVTAAFPDGTKKRVIQRLNAVAANEMIAGLHSLRGTFARLFKGLPIYDGHPDVPYLAHLYPDKTSKGWIKDLRIGRDDDTGKEQLELIAAYNTVGRGLIENDEFAFHSPHWGLKQIGSENGMPLCIPVMLYSTGLTNTPNIKETPPLAANTEEMTMDLLQRLIALFPEKNRPTDEQSLVTSVMALIQACTMIQDAIEKRWRAEDAARIAVANDAVWNEKAVGLITAANVVALPVVDLTPKVTELQGLLDAANTLVTTTTQEKETALASAANVRDQLAGHIIDVAIAGKKLKPEDRAAWLKEFEKDLPGTLAKAANTLSMKTESVVDLAGRGTTASPSQQFLDAVNDRMTQEDQALPSNERYDRAWNFCATVSHKPLFDLMQQPVRTFTGAPKK
jgi:hypothetical protein